MSSDVLQTPPLLAEERFVEFWIFQFDPHAVPDMELLSQAERDRASRYRSPEKRRQFVFCRSIGRTLFGRLLNLAPQEVEWSTSGPPILTRPGESPDYSISVSHTDEFLAFALARLPVQVGIDIEKSTSSLNVSALAEVALTEAEQRKVFNSPPDQQSARLRQLWTMKEAVLKSLCLIDLPGLLTFEIATSPFPLPDRKHQLRSFPQWLVRDSAGEGFTDLVFCFDGEITSEFEITGSLAARIPKSADAPDSPNFSGTDVKKVTEPENILLDQKKSKNSIVLQHHYRAKI